MTARSCVFASLTKVLVVTTKNNRLSGLHSTLGAHKILVNV